MPTEKQRKTDIKKNQDICTYNMLDVFRRVKEQASQAEIATDYKMFQAHRAEVLEKE